MKAAALLLLLCTTQTLAWKVAVISDVHLNVNYMQNVSAATYCEIDGKTQHTAWTDILAPLGRIGCDPPPALFERFLQRLNETEQPDILFMPGDFLGHSIPIEYPYIWDDARFAKLLSVHKTISDMLAKYLSSTLIVPTFGNNDWLFHYQAPYESNKTNFYPQMFEYWFKGQGVSGGRKDLAGIEETFNEGGYYRMDIKKLMIYKYYFVKYYKFTSCLSGTTLRPNKQSTAPLIYGPMFDPSRCSQPFPASLIYIGGDRRRLKGLTWAPWWNQYPMALLGRNEIRVSGMPSAAPPCWTMPGLAESN